MISAKKIELPTAYFVVSLNIIIRSGITIIPPPIDVEPTNTPQINPEKTAKILFDNELIVLFD